MEKGAFRILLVLEMLTTEWHIFLGLIFVNALDPREFLMNAKKFSFPDPDRYYFSFQEDSITG
jgi:hypothetical protein